MKVGVKVDVAQQTLLCDDVILKMTSLINKSADWPPPNYHKTARTFPNSLHPLI